MKNEFRSYEKKWQERWHGSGVFKTRDGDNGERSYILIEFPYPSGNGLHVGHARPYTAMDVVARKRRMQGHNVLFPMGWDAFGLPTENYAIANHIHPSVVTERNVKNFRAQCDMLGYSFDWDREINTTDPSYYKWTQWIFLKMLEKGLAYKACMPVNWCTSCLCVLANEEVVDGVCERCGSAVVRKEKSQWMLKITAYAQRLIDDLDTVDFIDRVKAQQRNWIGRSEGAEVNFKTTSDDVLRIYTTHPDTLFGATYMVISPEHPYVEKWKNLLENYDEVRGYREAAARKSDFERTEIAKDKTGIELKGVRAVNPVNGKEIPVYVSDYVLMSYGTGAIMAVPGHDTRDWEFARQFGLPVIEVVAGGNVDEAAYTDTETGKMVNSGFLDGLEVADAKIKITERLVEEGLGEAKVNYKLRDWVFSRQRYWGEPIPVIHCPVCGVVPVPYEELPLTLPQVDSYEPTESGESPISKIREWVEVPCPKCGAKSERETDTMPQWAGSSWYFLRYIDNHNDKEPASPEKLKKWMPVSWYNGGMEHTTLHLLYSRFWHKFLYDIGVVPTPEPYKKRTSHGMILGEGGEKMSKSRGNVINPNDIVELYGADTMRLYIMFIGDFEKAAAWSPQAVKGCRRFVEKVWALAEKAKPTDSVSPVTEGLLHKTIKKVTDDIEQLKFNTAIAQLMTLTNELAANGVTKGDLKILLRLLSPFAPHVSDELWEKLGLEGVCCNSEWPVYDPAKTVDSEVEMAVQVLGKLRASIIMPVDSQDAEVLERAVNDPKIKPYVEGKTIVRSIVVKNKLVNLVVR